MTKNCKQPCAAQHSSRVYAGVTQPCPPSLAHPAQSLDHPALSTQPYPPGLTHPALPTWPGPTSLPTQPCPLSRTWCAGPRKEGLPSTPRHTRLPGHPIPGPLITLVPPGHSMPSSQDPTWHPDQATHCTNTPLNTLPSLDHPVTLTWLHTSYYHTPWTPSPCSPGHPVPGPLATCLSPTSLCSAPLLHLGAAHHPCPKSSLVNK